jgi:hypothetical protein
LAEPRKRAWRRLAAALTENESLWPAVHEVPGATACTADQTPLAQRRNDVPLMQFHWPSLLQAVPGAKPPAEEPLEPEPLEPEPVVPVAMGALADEATVETTSVVGAAAAAVVLVAAWVGTVTKTPLAVNGKRVLVGSA